MALVSIAAAPQHLRTPPPLHWRLTPSPSSSPLFASSNDLHARRASSPWGPSTSCRCAAPEAPAADGAWAAAALQGRPGRKKLFDVVALSNLCVDIVVQVDALPPTDEASRRALLQRLTASPPPQRQWEVGAAQSLFAP